MHPLVSVIMPIYNSSKSLKTSAGSVLSQSYRNLELILIDDCSTDDTIEIAQGLCGSDNRVRLLRLDCNRGAGVARNLGIDKALGSHIAFLDSDDEWYADKLAKQIDFMSLTGAAFCASHYDVSKNGVRVETRKPKEFVSYSDLLRENVIGCLTVVYNCEFLGKVFMPSLRKRQDYALWLELLKRCDHCHVMQEPLANYNIIDGSISSNKVHMLYYNYVMFRQTQGFSRLKALLCLISNIVHKLN